MKINKFISEIITSTIATLLSTEISGEIYLEKALDTKEITRRVRWGEQGLHGRRYHSRRPRVRISGISAR
jgi:hypothetical protein